MVAGIMGSDMFEMLWGSELLCVGEEWADDMAGSGGGGGGLVGGEEAAFARHLSAD